MDSSAEFVSLENDSLVLKLVFKIPNANWDPIPGIKTVDSIAVGFSTIV